MRVLWTVLMLVVVMALIGWLGLSSARAPASRWVPTGTNAAAPSPRVLTDTPMAVAQRQPPSLPVL